MDTSPPRARLTPRPESSIPVLIAVAATITLQVLIPSHYTVVPRWPLLTLELLLVAVLITLNPIQVTQRTPLSRIAILGLLAAITFDNTASAILLDWRILAGKVSNDPAILLGSGAAIFLTNVIVFGIWYWELDGGGPLSRRDKPRKHPDFLFPQLATPDIAPPDWTPRFMDYLYLSVTNVMAFSPTDTMPLARWAKALMALQAMVALSMAALVFARAVNVLA